MSIPQPARTSQKRFPWLPLALILTVAGVLRYAASAWGLPGPTHIFSYHPDEFHSLRGALSLILMGDPNPHFFNYGSLYLYMVAVAAVLADSGTLGNLTVDSVARLLHDWTVAARNVNLLCALLTVVVTYLLARRLLGQRSGLLAAVALAVLPVHVLHSTYATVDVPQTLFVALTLLFSVRLAQRPQTREYLLAGLCAGLAASVKYNGVLVLVAPLVAHFAALREMGDEVDKEQVGLLAWQPLAMLAVALLAFALTSPYTFLDWTNARRDIFFELQHIRVGEEPARSADANGWLFHATTLTMTTAGAALVALCGVVGLWLRRLWRPALGVLVFAALWVCMISVSNVRYGRYEVPLGPAVALLVAATPLLGHQKRAEWRLLGFALPVLSTLAGLGVSVLLVTTEVRQLDPRDEARTTILRVVPPDRHIGLVWEPWFNSPAIDPCNGGQVLRHNPLWGRFRDPIRPLDIIGLDPARLQADRPFAFALSNFEIRDALRVDDPAAREFRTVLRDEYSPALVAERRAPLAGLWGWQPPQDWLYPFPQVTVYIRNNLPSERSAPSGH